MPLQHAIQFLNQLNKLPSLREALYSCRNEDELRRALHNEGFSFEWNEFEESVNMLHVRCQSYEQASDLMQKAEWFRMVLGSVLRPATKK